MPVEHSAKNRLKIDINKRSGLETSPNDESLYSEMKIWDRMKLSFKGNGMLN